MVYLALMTFVVTIAVLFEVAVGMRRMKPLHDVAPLSGSDLPPVSVVIPARNEERTIRPALLSVLAQDYGNLEVMVINDRSTDRTRDVLKKMQAQYPRLKVEHITELPQGWVGKNHALQYGAERAGGKYLLFTDADVVMEKTTLSRAMHHLTRNSLDHLCMFFEPIASSGFLAAVFTDVGIGLLGLFKPWKARNPKSKRYMGVGAFNLVRAEVYREIGRHHCIAMHPIDDIMLGKVIKRHGFKQDCLLGKGFVSVRWYESINDLTTGLMKNLFALFDYSMIKTTGALVFILVLVVLPQWALFFTHGIVRILYGMVIAVRFISFAAAFRQAGGRLRYAFWSFFTPYFIIHLVTKAAISTIRNKGIDWRGTYYSLDDLKAQKL